MICLSSSLWKSLGAFVPYSPGTLAFHSPRWESLAVKRGGGFICNHVQKRSAVWSCTLLWQTSSSSSYSGYGQSFKRDKSCPWRNKEQKLRERSFAGEQGVCYSDLKKIPQSQKRCSPSFSSSSQPVSRPAARQQLWHPNLFVLSDIVCFVGMSLLHRDYKNHLFYL